MKKLFILLSLLGVTVIGIHCQETTKDKQDIIDLINAETEAYLQHDYETWAKCWLNAPYAHHNYTTSSYHLGLTGWPELEQAFIKEFNTLPNPNYKIEKTNFDIVIMGNTAIAHLKEKYYNANQPNRDVWLADNNAVFEKKNGYWKIVGYNIVNKTTFKASEYDVLANLNLAGNMLMEMNMDKEALKVFDLCMEVQPETCTKYNRLGEVFLNMGKVDLAKQYFNKCLIVEPQNEVAQSKLIELQAK